MNNFKKLQGNTKKWNPCFWYLRHRFTYFRNFTVFCDMLTDGGGLTHVLSRFDNSQNFEHNWEDYKKGIGHPSGNFWIGLEPLYQLTSSDDYELRVELIPWWNRKFYALYNKFEIGGEEEGYFLKVVEWLRGNDGDGLSPLINTKFCTKDEVQYQVPSDCTQLCKGGWWHKTCDDNVKTTDLTGRYLQRNSAISERCGMRWMSTRGGSLKKVKMMIRPRNH